MIKQTFAALCAAVCLVACTPPAADTSAATYRNPIINADVPDMSLVFVDGYYYMISTTMHLMPGAPIMRSADLITWETVSYVFDRINDGDRYSLINGQTAYGQGQWASCIRHHNGQFYVWFTANGAPGKGFVYTAPRAEGPWTLIARPPHHHDASLLFDDDGRVFLYYDTGMLAELTPDLQGVKEDGLNMRIFEKDADEPQLLEGSQAFKYNGKYYLCMISMAWGIPGRVRREVCYRADSIQGPYEKKVILETPFESYGGVGQGCVLEGKGGQWYALMFQDRGGIGRTPCLMPCRWVDGWPILGAEDGTIPNDTTVNYSSMAGIAHSDDFSYAEGQTFGFMGDRPATLKLCWQWNHNPIDEAWSTSERPGFLRLKTARICDNIYLAPNTLTQRMTGPASTGTIKIDISNMKDGDRCGFWGYQSEGAALAIEKQNGKTRLAMQKLNVVMAKGPGKNIEGCQTEEVEAVDIEQNEVWLRILSDFNPGKDELRFAYSLDGETWKELGSTVKVRFDIQCMFMGTKFAIFNYATKELGGYIDVDQFVLE